MRLSKRERVLLTLCFLTLFIMANLIGMQWVIRGLRESGKDIKVYEAEETEQQMWLGERSDPLNDPIELGMKIDRTMPMIESHGRDQGKILEKLQDEAYDRKLRLERQNLLEPRITEYYQEVSVNIIVRGDLAKISDWLTTLQKPDEFYVIKNLELALDTKAREEEPQARCNLTLARWFLPPGAEPADRAPEETEAEPEESPEPEPEPNEPELETEPEPNEPELETDPKPERPEMEVDEPEIAEKEPAPTEKPAAPEESETETETKPEPEAPKPPPVPAEPEVKPEAPEDT